MNTARRKATRSRWRRPLRRKSWKGWRPGRSATRMQCGSSRERRREARAMNRSAADRVRSMQEKGTITAEQAEELLKALSEDPEDEPGTAGQDSGVEAGSGETAEGQGKAEEDTAPGRRGARRSRSFFDMEWVDDMVGGITSGLGISSDRGDWDPGTEKYAYDYHYEWDPRRGGRRGGNAQNSSRVEAPEGDSFEFRGNRVAFSKLSGMHYVRSRVKDNSFSAS